MTHKNRRFSRSSDASLARIFPSRPYPCRKAYQTSQPYFVVVVVVVVVVGSGDGLVLWFCCVVKVAIIMFVFVLYCILLYCIVLYCIVLYCIVLLLFIFCYICCFFSVVMLLDLSICFTVCWGLVL